MTAPTGKNTMLDNIVWSEVEYRLGEFVDHFTLPQLVKVQKDINRPNGKDSCIGAEQILTLHAFTTREKVLTRNRKNKEIHVPLNCCQRIELRPKDFRGVCETVEYLSDFKFVRVTQGYFNLDDPDENCSINPGDKLQVIGVEIGTEGEEGCILFRNQIGFPIRLPFSLKAGFQPLTDGREYYLSEVSKMELPVFFQFIDPPDPIGSIRAENLFNSSLGVLKLEKTYHDSTVICTTTMKGGVRTVVACPKELPITVKVAQGALEGDKDYTRLCRLSNDGISLSSIENKELKNIYASRDSVREYELESPIITPGNKPSKRSGKEGKQ